MKKVLIISFLIFTILMSFFNISYAAVAVTGDKIFDFFKKLESSNLTIKQVGEGVSSNGTISFDGFKITHEDNKILFTAPNDDGSNFELNYIIKDNKVSFSSSRTYNVDDIENAEEAMKEVTVLMLLNFTSSCTFLSVADIQNTDLSIAYAYFSEKLQTMSEESKSEITDDVFNYSQTSTDNSFSYNLEINLDNWSKVNSADSTGYAVTFTPITNSSTAEEDNDIVNTDKITDINNTLNNSIISSAQNSLNQIKENQEKENQALQNLIQNFINSQNSSNIKNQYNSNKLPQTGNFFNVQDALFLLILVSVVGIVVLIIPNAKYRKIK